MPRKRSHTRPIGPGRLSGRLLLIGLPAVLLGCCDLAARVYDGLGAGEVGLAIRLGEAGSPLLASLAILLGGALVLDYIDVYDGKTRR